MADKTNPSGQPQGKWQGMREDRPLDALFPELGGYQPPTGQTTQPGPDLWPHVMEVSLESTWQWAMASWSTPTNSGVFLKTLRRMLRRTIIQEWSKPPSHAHASGRRFEGVILFCFEPLDANSEAQMPALGFERLYGYEPDHYRERLSVLGEHAHKEGWHMPVQPAQLWWAPILEPEATLSTIFADVEQHLVVSQGPRVWGQMPGVPSKLMAHQLQKHMSLQLAPTLDALHELDMVLIERKAGALRWMPPMIFQALCDFIGIVASAELGKNIQWGVCEPDRYGGYYEPSLRMVTPKGPKDIEIGLALYDVVAAAVEDESSIPLLRQWVPTLFEN